jgi:tRNA pseudouridine38-40 synthase
MTRYKAIIEYDGTGFCGMQMQKEHLTVEGEIVKALKIITKQDTIIKFAGRTDAGVHALGQVIAFDFNQESIPVNKIISDYRIFAGLNFFLSPIGICAVSLEKTTDDFDPRRDAMQRSYIYKIINRRTPPVIDRLRKWHVPYSIDVEKMKEASKYFIGKYDFTSFRSIECTAPNPIRSIDSITITQSVDDIEILISARSFLHKMVRNIVGTLIEVAKNKNLEPSIIPTIIGARDRSKAFTTAPAHGLYFLKVEY